MTLLDGKSFSQTILLDLKKQFSSLNARLDIVLVGNDPASLKYTQTKQKIGTDLDITVNIHSLPATTNTVTVLNKITVLNRDPDVSAIMIQLPLPSQINTASVLNQIDPDKDVDGLTPTNLGRLFHSHKKAIASATAAGIVALLDHYQLNLDGKNAVIIGRSPEVALPLFALLNRAHATVTICHRHTKNLAQITSQADFLISSTGQPNLVTADMVKDGAVLVDVGYPTGDVDFDAVKNKVSFISPVPGGVGPMTLASLFSNLLKIYNFL